mmetsp:Transcript_5342/g.10422  ORF Transcript_5342/g.10422 Transcript_5342/m.10422 type:complete len:175 (-) Transcript_5342:583-1107(-)
MSHIRWEANFFMMQTAVVGGVTAGGACSILCHVWSRAASWVGVKNPNMLLEVVPLMGCVGAALVSWQARKWLMETARRMALETHGSEQEKMDLRSDVVISSALQTGAAGASGSLFVLFLTRVASDRAYGLMYEVTVALLGVSWLAMSLVCRSIADPDTVRQIQDENRGRLRKDQ